MISVGDRIPDFELENQRGETRTLKDYQNRWLVLYVYPGDGTPGCTIEGQAFSAKQNRFDELGVKIAGLSQDDVRSHQKFAQEYNLTVELLADPQNQLLQALGVGRKRDHGVVNWDRTTFLIDPKGVVRKIYENVKPDGHEMDVLRDVEQLQAEGPFRPKARGAASATGEKRLDH